MVTLPNSLPGNPLHPVEESSLPPEMRIGLFVANNPVNLWDPWGFYGYGIIVGGVAEGGAVVGFAEGLSISGGYGTFNPSLLKTLASGIGTATGHPIIMPGNTGGAFLSKGAFVAAMPGSTGWAPGAAHSLAKCPSSGQIPFALGATAGVGGGAFITNARNISDLEGPFETTSLNLPAVGFQISSGFAADNQRIWSFSITLGKSLGASFSSYPTTTGIIPRSK